MNKCKKSIKIMFLLSSQSYSGAENVIIQIITNLNKSGDSYDCVYVSKDGSIRRYLENNNIRFIPVNDINLYEIRKIIKQENPDIIHANDFRASILSAFSCRNIALISHIHCNPLWAKKLNLYTFMYFLATFRFSEILTVSDSIQNEFFFKTFIRRKVQTIGNPINITTLQAKTTQAYVQNNNTYDIVFLGRLSSPKDPIRFLEIMTGLQNKLSFCTAIMIGDGELLNNCKEYIETHGLKCHVKLAGFQENPYPYLRESKVLCMPSKYEGFGLAAVEALACNIPVVCTNVGGLPLIVDDTCGKLCVSNQEFMDEIYLLLTDQNYYQTKKIGASEKAHKLDNIDAYTQSLQHVYEEILA